MRTSDVLSKWKLDFETLYNITSTRSQLPIYDNPVESNRIPESSAHPNQDNRLNDGISILEVREAVRSLNKNRAVG